MPSLKESFQFCRRLARKTGRNFYFSFLTLPRAKRDAMCVIYAWMRQLDDLADDTASKQDAREALEKWREHTRAALKENSVASFHPPSSSLWPAFADTVKRYHIPTEYFDQIVEGALMDQEIMRYKTFGDLYGYCYRVASVVGLVCLRIFGYTDPQAEKTGEWLGIAFQLTNILRDVREDAERGRIYLPLEDLQKYGISEDDILKCRWSPALGNLLEAFAQHTEEYYIKAKPVFGLVSKEAQATLKIMEEIYHGILIETKKHGFRVFEHRARVPTWKKFFIVVKCQVLGTR